MTVPQPLVKERDQAQAKRSLRATVLVLLIFVPFLIQAIAYLKILLRLIITRNEVLNPEGLSIYCFLNARLTGKLYSPLLDFPWNEKVYGPVYYTVGAMLAVLAHGDPMRTTILARLLSFLSFLGAAVLVGYIGWKLEGQKRWAAVCVVLGLACYWAIPFPAIARPDSLSIFFILAALACYLAAEGSLRLLFLAGILGALSFFTKQSTAPVLLALLLDSLIARKFRNAAALTAGSAVISAFILSVLWLRHEPFLENFQGEAHVLFNWSSVPLVFSFMLRVDQSAAVLIGIAVLGAAYSWKKEKYRVILLAALLGWISNVAALANTGAAANYLMLPWLLTVLLVPAGLERLEEYSQHSWWAPAGLILLSTGILIHQRVELTRKPLPDLDASTVSRLKMLTVNNAYLELRSSEPQLLDSYFYHQLSMHNKWSIAPVTQKIDGQEYDLILLGGEDGASDSEFLIADYRGTSFLGEDTLSEIRRHYRALCEVPNFLALVPADRPGNLRPEDMARIFGQPCQATSRLPQMQPGTQ